MQTKISKIHKKLFYLSWIQVLVCNTHNLIKIYSKKKSNVTASSNENEQAIQRCNIFEQISLHTSQLLLCDSLTA